MTEPKSKTQTIREQGPALLAQNYTHGDIARMLGVTRQLVGQVLGPRTAEEKARARLAGAKARPYASRQRNPDNEREVGLVILLPASVSERLERVRGKQSKRQYAFDALLKQIEQDEQATKA